MDKVQVFDMVDVLDMVKRQMKWRRLNKEDVSGIVDKMDKVKVCDMMGKVDKFKVASMVDKDVF